MAISYFDNFPQIVYKDKAAKNILLRAALRETVKRNSYVYLPLSLEEGERVDMVAHDLYENSNYAWLVKFANDIVDPYYDWLLTEEQFSSYIAKKYGSLEAALGLILHYKNIANPEILITKDTYDLFTSQEKTEYVAVYAYDFESEKNEAKRQVSVISPQFSSIIDSELEKKLND